MPMRRGRSQISPPIRIVLIAALAFLAAWMTFLKPSTEEPAPPAAPAATAKSTAVAPASATPTATPNAPAPPERGQAITGLPRPVARAIERDRVLALLFWDRRSPEDRAVRASLRRADRWDGRVYAAAVPVGEMSRYGRIADGVVVGQSPTLVVVDRKLRATPLVGYVDTQTIDQAVVDALRASGGLFTDAYLREVNDICAGMARSLFAIPSAQSPRELPRTARRHLARWQRFTTDLRALPAPPKWRPFKRAAVADAAAMEAVFSAWSAGIARNTSTASVIVATQHASRRLSPIGKRFSRRMDARHVLSCGSNG